jgi:predicted ribosome quality control (RQC) complex YloA/Tae2 family protein
MVFDGLFIYHLINELNTHISKSRIEKVYQTGEFSFLLVLFVRGQRHRLKIDLSPSRFGFYLTKTEEKSQTNSQFLNTLKKHIEGGILENITQLETDRVIIFNITVYDFIDGPISKQLIFEAMGKHSNLILVYQDLIVDTFKKMFFESGRQLLPQATFEHFPSTKESFLKMTHDDLISPKHVVDHFLGISPFLANYLCDHHLLPTLLILNPTRCLSSKKEYVADLFDESNQKLHFQSISEMMDDQVVDKKPIYIAHQNFILKQIDKYQRKYENYESLLEEATLNLSYKFKGDMIYQSGLDLNIKQNELIIDEDVIKLDPTKSLNLNAQHFYKLYQKAKKSILHLETHMKETQLLIAHFEHLSHYVNITSSDSIKDLETELIPYGFKKLKSIKVNKKQSVKPNILRIVDLDATYLIGKNNIQNEYITHTLANSEDYWFHVKDATGAHLVVQTKSLTENVLRKAAMLSAYFSQMRNSSSIPVDYTLIRNIKKIPKLPGYQVIYKNHKTIYIDINTEFLSKFL